MTTLEQIREAAKYALALDAEHGSSPHMDGTFDYRLRVSGVPGIKGSLRTTQSTAELFAAAPHLLAAIDAVHTLHTRVAIYECDDDGFPQTEDESKHVRDICGTCSDSSVTENLDDGNYDLAGEWGEVGYPCPTVKAIASALGGEV